MGVERVALIEQVRAILARAGFAVSERCDLRPVSFDLVARRDDTLLIVKVLTNVDALSEPVAQEVKVLAQFLHARPVLVGLRAGTGELEHGVVYNRHDVPIVTLPTLVDYVLEGQEPMVYAAPGGFYVRLDSEALRDARRRMDLSLGVLAQMAGVSRRAIQMYEEGMSASIDAAMRLEEFLDTDLIKPVDPFSFVAQEPPPQPEVANDPAEALATQLLEALGYTVRRTARSPFNALSTQRDDTLLTGMAVDANTLRRRARIVASVSRVTERPGFFVVERSVREELHGVPVVRRAELERLGDPERILELILERARAESS